MSLTEVDISVRAIEKLAQYADAEAYRLHSNKALLGEFSGMLRALGAALYPDKHISGTYQNTSIDGVILIQGERHEDARGYFGRILDTVSMTQHGLESAIVQSSDSFSLHKGTIRGIHWQNPPHEEIKIVRCIAGKVFEVVVDLRPLSPTYMKWQGFLLEPSEYSLYVPKGCGLGFQTLEPNSVVSYKMTVPYTPSAGAGLCHDDPAVGIKWPLPCTMLGEKDQNWPGYKLHDAVQLAKTFMTGRTHSDGTPYFHHDVAVMRMLPPDASQDERIAALLHSVIDLGAATLDQLKSSGNPLLTPEILQMVYLVTNIGVYDFMSYLDRVAYIANSGNVGAMRVKLADMLVNRAAYPDRDYERPMAILENAIASRSQSHAQIP